MLNEAIVPPCAITSNAVFIRNNLFDLASTLKEVLSKKERSLRTIIIIPSNPIKDFLTQYLTDTSEGFFGVRFLTLAQGIDYFIKTSYSDTYLFPTITDLSLYIESLLINPPEKLLPLISYLGNDRNKITALSQELAPIFLYYGIYGGTALDAWEKNDGWQQVLWHEVVKIWSFPCHVFKNNPAPRISNNIIFFNIPHIPEIYKSFLEKLSENSQVTYFHKRCTSENQISTLQYHEASSPLREIEILMENLKLALQDGSVNPEDITVMASDLNLYFPHIQFVFEQESSSLGYSISGLSALPHNHYLKTVDLFFQLTQSRFERESVIDLLFSSPISKKQNFTSVEFSLLHQIIDDMNIEWGFDQEMKREILEVEAISERGSWKFAFEKILESLAFSSSIEISKFETLGNLLFFLETLFTDLRSLGKKEDTLSNWITLLDELLNKYFPDTSELDFILKEIHSLNNLASVLNSQFLFPSIHSLIKKILAKKTFEKSYSKKPIIQFVNLSEAASLDREVIFLLGLCEDSFPRKRVACSLNELKGLPGSNHQPENSENDRLYFQESLMSAKKALIISYVGLSEKDGKPLAPSLCVQELLRNYTSNPIIKHPNIAFYPKTNKTLSFSIIALPDPPIAIDIRHLIEVAKHPIRYYCNRVLGVYLDKAPEKDSREFFLSYLDKSIAVDAFQKKDNEEFLAMWETKNILPTALFREQAKIELLNELKEVHLGLKTFSISQNEFFSIHFDTACKEPQFLDDARYIHPAIQITLEDGRKFTLTGKLPSLSKQGIYIHKEYSVAELWKHLPHLCILGAITSPAPPNLLFGKDLTTKSSNFPLTSLIEYYLEASNSPSPLLPEQIDKLLKKKLFSPTTFFDDPYLTFLAPDLTKNGDPYLTLLET